MKTTLANPVLDFINTLCNFVVLNLVFLISCLPVITIGTALSSLYYVTLREARGEYGYLVRTYIKEFRKNLKSGTAAFAVLFVIGAVILFNLAFWFNLGGIPAAVITGLMAVGAIVWLFTFTYTFPLIARFNNSTKQTLINAFCLMMSADSDQCLLSDDEQCKGNPGSPAHLCYGAFPLRLPGSHEADDGTFRICLHCLLPVFCI